MIYTATICVLAWLVTYLSWVVNVDGFDVQTHLPPELHVAQILVLYFIFNAAIDLIARYLITRVRIRWHTEWLSRILLISVLLHVVGGIGYALGLNYEGLYTFGLWAVVFAQILAFMGPSLHRRFCVHVRVRRHIRHASGNGGSTLDWPDRD